MHFSIGAKLITITTILVLLSLGSITLLVSWLVSQDLKITAEENNFEVNRRSASEAENYFSNLVSNSLLVMQAMHSVGPGSKDAKEIENFFFDHNRHIAGIIFAIPGRPEQLSINEYFFLSRDIDLFLAYTYGESHRNEIRRAAGGETLLENAAPHFSAPLLVLFFPWQDNGSGAIIFSAESIGETFGFGTNQSYLINGECDILIHANYDLVRAGANVANRNYIRDIRENPLRNMQSLYTDDGVRYFGAFTKLDTGDSIVITSIEYNKIFEGLAATTWRNVYLTAAVLCISVLFIWFFSKSISVPLKKLASAANTIERGVFNVELHAEGSDEIGQLTNSFQRMSSALEIFGKFTNRDLAVRAMRGELKPGGLPKHAAIFFSDVRDFSRKSEIITNKYGDEAPDRIVFWLNGYLTKMVECIEKTGGVVDKFIGDAVMAHWGTAFTSGNPKDDALNGIKAALMMRSALILMNSGRTCNDPDNPTIEIGCSLNTGVVTAGQIGSDLRMEYTVIGVPVNAASRIESLNKQLGTDILITGETWELVKDHIITEEMPHVQVKGIEKPIRVFAVINLIDSTEGPRTLAELRSLLDLETPDLTHTDVNANELKYSFGGHTE